MKQILEEVRKETGVLRPSLGGANSTNGDHHQNGTSTNGSNGKKAAANGAGNSLPGPGEASNLHGAPTASLALPQAAVDEALRVTKEVLDQILEFEEDKENGTS